MSVTGPDGRPMKLPGLKDDAATLRKFARFRNFGRGMIFLLVAIALFVAKTLFPSEKKPESERLYAPQPAATQSEGVSPQNR